MKKALITGAASGVGLELTKKLLAEGWEVIAFIRAAFPAGEAEIKTAIENKTLRIYNADLSDFTSLHRGLKTILAQETSIDVLFNNAGVSLGALSYSPQGREMHYEVNTVVPYIITQELKPLLQKGSLKTILHTSSNALLTVKNFDPAALARPKTFRKLFGPYAASKLALSLWAKAIASDFQAAGMEMRTVCPGPNQTPMTKSAGMPVWLLLLRKFLFSPPSEGANRLSEAASPKFKGVIGEFIEKGKIRPFNFQKDAQIVLRNVDVIYREEFQNK